MEARWPGLAPDSEKMREFLQHPIAADLREFQSINPLFVEIFVTDARGRLLATTEKTSDYFQADEEWWQRAWSAKLLGAEIDGIHYDESAVVYSVDVAVPIRDRRSPDDPPVGVVKGVINASPLLSQVAPPATSSAIREVVLGDGRVLARFDGVNVEPLKKSIASGAAARLTSNRSGWMIAPMGGGEKNVVGFAPLRLRDADGSVTPMFVLVHQDARTVLAPVRKQIAVVSAIGALLVLGCAFAGYVIAGHEIIAPIEVLRSATHAIASTAKLDEHEALARPLPMLQPIEAIRSRDELGELARDFSVMAARVLTYHERLEIDIASKTAEIDRDLQMAREFQEALMPHEYPKVPTDTNGATIRLDFHHIYFPASSVGGDFFDVMKLSDHRAGIFIADVMGHGARSALVTAILRALLQNLAFATGDPALFLDTLNQHFHTILRDSQETIFVSAFYLIVDTKTATATYASAGHPSPFFANRATRRVAALIPVLKANPALGIFPAARYQKWSRPIGAGDFFVLFTDGVHEAYNAAGEEFGLERLKETIIAQCAHSGGALGKAIIDAVQAFIAPAAPADDICLVAVEVLAAAEAGGIAAASAEPALPAAATPSLA
jgi:serine phosphatase RsbU (regulator of sigma subunit)